MRDKIRAEVEAISPFDERERETQRDVLAWIDSGVELCRIKKPDVPNKHLVSYFLLVEGEHILLVDHKLAGLWLPSGGHVEAGEHPRQTVIREAHEELMLTADFLQPAPLFVTATQTVGTVSPHMDVSLWYLLHGERDKTIEYDKREFHTVRWFYKGDVPYERADPELRRCLEKFYRS